MCMRGCCPRAAFRSSACSSLPQGRDDAENQARYHLIDFVLDPVPYSGVNGTLEALDMGVPVVTLCGRKHGERTSYSILANLGVAADDCPQRQRVRRHRRAARDRCELRGRSPGGDPCGPRADRR